MKKIALIVCMVWCIKANAQFSLQKKQTLYVNEIHTGILDAIPYIKFDVNNTEGKEKKYLLNICYLDADGKQFAYETVNQFTFVMGANDGKNIKWLLNPNLGTPKRIKVEVTWQQ